MRNSNNCKAKIVSKDLTRTQISFKMSSQYIYTGKYKKNCFKNRITFQLFLNR